MPIQKEKMQKTREDTVLGYVNKLTHKRKTA
jgi:hypothetical protein